MSVGYPGKEILGVVLGHCPYPAPTGGEEIAAVPRCWWSDERRVFRDQIGTSRAVALMIGLCLIPMKPRVHGADRGHAVEPEIDISRRRLYFPPRLII
jgi:hypothetical protein